MFSGKGKEPAWPKPLDAHAVTFRKSLSQATLPQPHSKEEGVSENIPPAETKVRSENRSSVTWTSSENPDLLLEEDENDSRERFVVAYNRLAQRHGIRPLIPGDFPATTENAQGSGRSRQGSWLSKILRQPSEQKQSKQVAAKPSKHSLRHQRSHDTAPNLPTHKRDALKNLDLKDLVRICGKSPLFLPPEYAPFSLTLPTCFRALAQALVQNADTKGIFRVSGSARAIDALYDYYCTDISNLDGVSSTTRCPTLPAHIKCNTHDVAGTFKRMLAGLPGGILGSLSLFDALVAIHCQLQGVPESHRTKESRLRARLIALAIGTVKSQYQRELICAVFGLLCLVGRLAENAPREDESGHPLPTTDLMGYHALGIVFGPLLVGELIDNYSMKVANPSAGLVLLPISAPMSRKEGHQHRHKHKKDEEVHEHAHLHEHKHEHKHKYEHHQHERIHEHKYKHMHRHRQHRHENPPEPSAATTVAMDKIHVANSITEMLIVHWREVVRQIRDTGSVKTYRHVPPTYHGHPEVPKDLSKSASGDSFSLKPPYHDHGTQQSPSPSEAGSTPSTRMKASNGISKPDNSLKAPPPPLSPTVEEGDPHVEQVKPSDGKTKEKSPVFINPVAKINQETFTLAPEPLRLPRHDDVPEPADAIPPIRVEDRHVNETSITNPADQWKKLLASSKASIESLAKSAKERRLMRSSGNLSSRSSREALGQGDVSPVTPARKTRLAQQRSEPRLNPTISPEKRNIMEGKPMFSRSTLALSPTRDLDAFLGNEVPTPRRTRRSPSKPMPGAVRAMTALFDNPGKTLPRRPPEALPRGGDDQSEANRFPDRDSVPESPGKPSPPQSILKSASSIRSMQKQAQHDEPCTCGNASQTPPSQHRGKDSPATKSFSHKLQPAKRLPSRGKEAQSPPEKSDMGRSQPPKLGSMLPHPEEPEVGQFLRRSSETSKRSHTDEMYFGHPSPRHISGNSVLHSQIRSLQRQLELRHEEYLHVLRQLETLEHLDIGTLCEQLRMTKRECKTWRKRAEAAEKRLAVFQQFGAKFQALNDGADDYSEETQDVYYEAETDSVSSCSAHVDDEEGYMTRTGHDRTEIGTSDSGYEALYRINTEETSDISAPREHPLPRGGSRRIVRLWEERQQALGVRRDDSSMVWD
ncbi:hypothetical protein GGR50DRAFT_303284 [Xylaria sp. CBS 124048]|nr:hypothetical protein GGR50DRAFT_303284 [Xylaria sp. CBS 124048]